MPGAWRLRQLLCSLCLPLIPYMLLCDKGACVPADQQEPYLPRSRMQMKHLPQHRLLLVTDTAGQVECACAAAHLAALPVSVKHDCKPHCNLL